MARQLPREGVFKLHERIEEQLTLLTLITFLTLIVNVDQAGVVNLRRNHLWQEMRQ